MSKYLVYNINALENIKLAKTNMQIDAQDTLDYISGSAVRGAYIYKYIKEYGLRDINTGVHREKLLAGGIKFLNAYPVFRGKRSQPLPRCYFAPKSLIKAFTDKLDIRLGLDKSLPPGFERVKLSEFVHKEGERYTKIAIDKVSNLHINKSEEKNRLYRYESIKKGQIFSGIIKAERDEYIEEIINLFLNQIVYIGGSKGSGYGRCIIEDIKVVDRNPEVLEYIIEEDSEYLYLIAISDIIYRTDIGTYSTMIDENIIKYRIGLNSVKYMDSSIDTNSICSFNNKWNARTPNIVAIKAGSVFKFEIDGRLNKSRIEKFIDDGIGERKAEGFGRIALTTNMTDMEFYADKEKVEGYKGNIELSSEEQKIIDLIADRVHQYRVEQRISTEVLNMDKNLMNVKEFRQWGTWKDFFLYLSRLDIEDGKNVYRKYMDHIISKKGKSYKDMERVKYKVEDGRKLSLREFFEKRMDEITKRTKSNDIFKDCEVAILDHVISADDQTIYRTNLKILSELCRYQVRKEEIL